MPILSIKNLSKSFGKSNVINQLSLSVPEQSVFGFIGKNGSGKTTTMRMILGLLKPDSGYIEVCGERVRYGDTKTNRHIGYLPDVPEFYGYMTPHEYLKLCGEITGLPQSEISRKSDELLSLVGLEKNKKRIGSFSRGMKQRLGIAQALIHEPKLLICDEPTSALDPIGRKDILGILAEVKKRTTVIFSTHVLSDVERICDNVGILNDGKIAFSGTMDEIKKLYSHESISILFADSTDIRAFLSSSSLKNLNDVPKVTENSVTLYSKNTVETMNEVMGKLIELKIAPLRLELLEPTLENLFLEMVK